MIKRAFYSYLCERIVRREDVDKLVVEHAREVSRDALLCIYSQKVQEMTRKTLHKHRKPQVMAKYYNRYIGGEGIVDISKSISLSPCLLARLILHCHLLSTVKEEHKIKAEVSKFIKEPSLLSDERLCKEVQECVECDDNYSPLVDKIRRETGEKYEESLNCLLQSINIPFMNEEEMRVSGYPKTPDAKLLIPFAINGFIVNWIDSKASFCDDYSMQFTRDQFLSYVNRYGSGLVIYWFGFIEELNNMQQDGILLMDQFPQNGIEFLKMPQFAVDTKRGVV